MSSIKFNDIRTYSEFRAFFNVSEIFLDYFLVRNPDARFSTSYIPKKTGGFRKLDIPHEKWKYLLNEIRKELEKIYIPPDNVVGFVKGKSIISGAENHIDKNIVVNIDLKDYFHSINFGRVRGLFMSAPFSFNNKIATLLAKVVTFGNKLPMGSPCSPIISNMIAYRLDWNFINYCRKFKITYTRYADDLTFSSNQEPRTKGRLIGMWEENYKVNGNFFKIIKNEGFKTNEKKTKILLKNKRQQVTNITVNKKPNVNRKYLKNLRAALHNIKLDIDKSSPKEVDKKRRSLEGKLHFFRMVKGADDNVFLKYAKQFNEIFMGQVFDIDLHLSLDTYIANRIVVIETEVDQGTGFIVKAENKFYLVTSTHNFVDKDGNKKADYFTYFYLKEKGNVARLLIDKITAMNINEDIIIFKITNTNLINKVGNKKFFNLSEELLFPLGYKVVTAGFNSYTSKITEKHTQENSEITTIQKYQGRENTYQIRDNVIKHGMSGGPIVNELKQVIGVNYGSGNEDKHSYFRMINKEKLEKMIGDKYGKNLND